MQNTIGDLGPSSKTWYYPLIRKNKYKASEFYMLLVLLKSTLTNLSKSPTTTTQHTPPKLNSRNSGPQLHSERPMLPTAQ